MKKYILPIHKIAAVIATAGLLAAATPGFARKNGNRVALSENNPPTVTVTQQEGNGKVFTLEMANTKNQQFEALVEDENGEMIFSQLFDGASFSKAFKFVNEGDQEGLNLRFTIRNIATGMLQTYQLSKSGGSVLVTPL